MPVAAPFISPDIVNSIPVDISVDNFKDRTSQYAIKASKIITEDMSIPFGKLIDLISAAYDPFWENYMAQAATVWGLLSQSSKQRIVESDLILKLSH
jgi:hypothetical protein